MIGKKRLQFLEAENARLKDHILEIEHALLLASAEADRLHAQSDRFEANATALNETAGQLANAKELQNALAEQVGQLLSKAGQIEAPQ